MLCLPIDILAHHVTRGNTALQEPLGVALGVLEGAAWRGARWAAVLLRQVQQHWLQAAAPRCHPSWRLRLPALLPALLPPSCPACADIEAFRQALVQADVARAQAEGASPDATASAASLCKRLKELVARLDSVLPYLNLAISTVALLNTGEWRAWQLLVALAWWAAACAHPAGLLVETRPAA